MRRQAVDATLRKLLATSLACMLVTIARIVQLGTSLEVLEDQCCGEVTKVSGRFLIICGVCCDEERSRSEDRMEEIEN